MGYDHVIARSEATRQSIFCRLSADGLLRTLLAMTVGRLP